MNCTQLISQTHRADTRHLTDENGAVTDSYDYTAFGELFASTGTTENSYLYTGQQFDDFSGLYSLRARYYNPAAGRFQSRDVYPYNISNPVELNRYGYTANNPINWSDPTGWFADKAEGEKQSTILATIGAQGIRTKALEGIGMLIAAAYFLEKVGINPVYVVDLIAPTRIDLVKIKQRQLDDYNEQIRKIQRNIDLYEAYINFYETCIEDEDAKSPYCPDNKVAKNLIRDYEDNVLDLNSKKTNTESIMKDVERHIEQIKDESWYAWIFDREGFNYYKDYKYE